MNLFIIGAGFDISHNVPGRYADFKSFMENIASPYYLEQPCASTINGMKTLRPFDAINVLKYIISKSGNDEEWKCFEETLGILDFSEFLIDTSSGEDMNYICDYNKQTMDTFFKVSNTLKELFENWVVQIPVKAAKNSLFSKLLSSNDIYLDFNYTNTLERTYAIQEEHVFHIHGEQGKPIIFGHGDSNYDFDYLEPLYPGAAMELADIKARLRKPVDTVLKGSIMSELLKQIRSNNIANVYSYGFGYSDIDMPYIEAISSFLSNDTVWLFNNFDKSKIPSFKEKVKKAGFKGTFDTFSTEHPKEA